MKNILYISRAGLPIDAAGVRTFHIGNILEKLEFHIHYITDARIGKNVKNSGYEKIDSDSTYSYLEDSEHHFRIEDKIYSYLPEQKRKNKLNIALEILELITARRLFNRVVRYCEKEKPSVIFIYNCMYGITKKLIPFCKKRGIKLFSDVTEWYDISHQKSLPAKMVANLTEKRIVKLDKKLDGVIAISSYLKHFYDEVGAHSIWMPPLMEMSENEPIVKYDYYNDKKVVNFVYAGAPGSKDILIPFIKAIQRINENEIRARFDIVGIEGSYFAKFPDVNQNLEQTGIFAHGRVLRDKALEIVKKSDFGILFRHNKRYAKAGFSTKFAECMSLGVPMLCNAIGGCDSMIKNGDNGFVTKTSETDEIFELLERIIAMPGDSILEMKLKTREFAFEHFAPDNYVEQVKLLIDSETVYGY